MSAPRVHVPRMGRLRLAVIACAAVVGAIVPALAVAAPTSFHIVTNYSGSNAYLFDGDNAYQRTYATVASPQFAVISPDGAHAAISSAFGKASIINLLTHVVTEIDLTTSGSSLGKPVFSTDSRYLFLPQRIITGTSPYKMKVHRVDLTGASPTTQTAEIAAITSCGTPAAAMQVSGGSDRLWVACYTNESLTPLSDLYGATFAPSAGTSRTLTNRHVTDMVISTDQSTAYLSQLNSAGGVRKVDLATGMETDLLSVADCSAVLVDTADAYVYASCGPTNGSQAIYRIPTAGGTAAMNTTNAATNAFQIAFGPSESTIWQPDLGPSYSGGTAVKVWTTSALGGGASARSETSTPAFNGASGIAFGVRASVPDAPTGVSGTPGDAQATVSWTAPASDGGAALTSYTVTAAPGGNTCSATPPQTSCTVTGLTNGTAYTFSVVAANGIGSGPASASSTAVTPVAAAAPCEQPSSPSASPSTPSSGASGEAPSIPAPALRVRAITPRGGTQSVVISSRVRVNGAGRIRQAGTRIAGPERARAGTPATVRTLCVASRAVQRAGARSHGATRARVAGRVLCTASRSVARAGTFPMTCTLGAAARRDLMRGPIRLRLTTTFTATSGQVVRSSRIVVLQQTNALKPSPVTG